MQKRRVLRKAAEGFEWELAAGVGHPPAGLGGVTGKFGGRRSSVRALRGPKHGKHLSIPTNEHRASRKQKMGGKMGWKKKWDEAGGANTSHLVQPHCRDEPSSPSQPYWKHKHWGVFFRPRALQLLSRRICRGSKRCGRAQILPRGRTCPRGCKAHLHRDREGQNQMK